VYLLLVRASCMPCLAPGASDTACALLVRTAAHVRWLSLAYAILWAAKSHACVPWWPSVAHRLTAGVHLAGLYSFAAIVNINLAVVNTLPLPALDGGYFLLLIVEAFRGKKMPPGIEAAFQVGGFVLLMGVGILLLLKDTINVLPKF
jgi:membrane-associated protease RseP (regulator of RpoE activity)